MAVCMTLQADIGSTEGGCWGSKQPPQQHVKFPRVNNMAHGKKFIHCLIVIWPGLRHLLSTRTANPSAFMLTTVGAIPVDGNIVVGYNLVQP